MQYKKPQLFARSRLWKHQEKLTKRQLFKNRPIFGIFSAFFSESIPSKELRFAAWNLVHQDASFALSNSTFWQFFRFLTIRGYPYDFGGLQIYWHSLGRSKIENNNSFRISRANLRPWQLVEMAPREMVDLVIALTCQQPLTNILIKTDLLMWVITLQSFRHSCKEIMAEY